MRFHRTRRTRMAGLFLAASHLASLMAPLAAAPEGGQVTAGTAAIQQSLGGSLTEIRQQSDRAIIDWQGFSTAAGETVRFHQPSATSVVLNRVVSMDPSLLNGALESNGRLFLINPAGIVFGPTSRVQVGSLVASTLGITDGDFLAGRYRLVADPGRSLAAIVNHGHITAAPGGQVALLAPMVDNRGQIVAVAGRVVVAGTRQADLDLDRGLVSLDVPSTANPAPTVGTDTALNPFEAVVNNEGLTDAVGIVRQGDRVMLGGTEVGTEGMVHNVGVIDVSGGQGGRVTLDSSRGTVLAPGSRISANATAAQGQGGSVRALSSGRTVFAEGSTMEARGGVGGRGGQLEVSGSAGVAVAGHATTRTEQGTTGDFLIDPIELRLVDTGSTAGSLSNLLVEGMLSADAGITAGADLADNTITVAQVVAASEFNNVVLEAQSKITLEHTTDIVLAPGSSLTLRVRPDAAGREALITTGLSIADANAGATRGKIITSGTNANVNFFAGQNGSPEDPGFAGTLGQVLLHGMSVEAHDGGNINIVANGPFAVASVSLDQITATAVSIVVSGGSVLDGNDSGINITAGTAAIGSEVIGASGAGDLDFSVPGGLSLAASRDISASNTVTSSLLDVVLLTMAGSTLSVVQGAGTASESKLAIDSGALRLTRSDASDNTGGTAVNSRFSTVDNDITVGEFNAGAGSVRIHSQLGGVLAPTAATNLITGGTTELFAATTIGTATKRLETKVTTLTAAAGNGVFINQNGNVNVVGAIGGTVLLKASHGDVTLGTVDAGPGDVTIEADDGGLLASSTLPHSITGGTTVLKASKAVGADRNRLATRVTSLNANGSEGVFVNQNGNVNIVGAVGEHVKIGVDGNVDVTGPVTAVKDVSLTARALNGTSALGTISGTGVITGPTGVGVAAGGAIGGSSNLRVSSPADVTARSGGRLGLQLEQTPSTLSLVLDDSAAFVAVTNGSADTLIGLDASDNIFSNALPFDLSIASPGTLRFANLQLGAHDVTLESTAGALLTAAADSAIGTPAAVITADDITLRAGTGIGTKITPLGTAGATLTARTETGDIFVAETDDLRLKSVLAPAGDVGISSALQCLTVDTVTASGDVTLSAVGGSVKDGNAAGLNITARNAVFEVCAYVGSAADPLEVSLGGKLDATGFGVFVANAGATTLGTVRTTFDSQITSAGDLKLGRFQANQGVVGLTATAGSILDDNGGGDNLIATGGARFVLTASGTIGGRNALEVRLEPGSIAVNAGVADSMVSARFDGIILPSTSVEILAAPGLVLFGNRGQTRRGDDVLQVVRTDPSQSVGSELGGRHHGGASFDGGGSGGFGGGGLIDLSGLGLGLD